MYVNLQHLDDHQMPGPGSLVQIENLNTATPKIGLPDGTTLTGKYEDTIGAFLFFEHSQRDQLPAADKSSEQPKTELLCHTEKQIVMRAHPPSVPP